VLLGLTGGGLRRLIGSFTNCRERERDVRDESAVVTRSISHSKGETAAPGSTAASSGSTGSQLESGTYSSKYAAIKETFTAKKKLLHL